MALAERYAEHHMRTNGSLPLTLFMITPGGLGILGKESLAEAEKDYFADTAKLMCRAYAATVIVLAAETWSAPDRLDDKSGEIVPASKCPDRREMVLLMGESRNEGQNHKQLPILRSDDGKFSGFGKSEVSPGPMEGRFTHFLPTTPPDEDTQRAVEAILKLKPSATGKLPE